MTRFVNILKLKSIMALKGFNITTLSEKMGISRNTLSAIFNGKNPSYPIMCKIVETLNIEEKTAGEIFFAINLPIK